MGALKFEQEVKWLHYHQSREVIKVREKIVRELQRPTPTPPTQTPRILEPLEYNFGILEKDKKGQKASAGKTHTKTPNNSLPHHPLSPTPAFHPHTYNKERKYN
jgi:hypothetical protein